MTRAIAFIGLALALMGASCKPIPEDKSALAAEAGESTIVLGSCGAEFNKGWAQCLIESTDILKMPWLRFVMTNPGEYAVGDCELGLFKSGAVDKAGLVEIDLSGLTSQIKKNKFCILKIETRERYPDNRDKNQTHEIYMRGGLFVELVESGYFPTPSPDVIAFCVKVSRTTKGRTNVENCK